MKKCSVELSKDAKKDLWKVPGHIAAKLQYWIAAVETYGIAEVRKVVGFHDEPLKGNRSGQRSIRLSKSYRAIYFEKDKESLTIVLILEVTKHEY